jgi:hypothetical protein
MSPEVFNMLVDMGADMSFGHIPVIDWALTNHHRDIALSVLQSLPADEINERYPVMAILFRHKRQDLIEWTCDMGMYDKELDVWVRSAACYSRVDALEFVSTTARDFLSNDVIFDVRSVLEDAVQCQSWSSFNYIIDRQNLSYGDLARALYKSIGGPNEMTQKLLDIGASPRYDRSSPLRTATYSGLTDTVRLLLKYGADPNDARQSGFLFAIRCSRLEMVKQYLANGATVGSTAIKTALISRNTDIINLLCNQHKHTR